MDRMGKHLDSTEPKRRSSVLRVLYDVEDDDGKKYEETCLEADEELPEGGAEVGLSGNGASLSDVRAWLDTECERERFPHTLQTSATKNVMSASEARGQAMDTRILERIRRGEGPRDKVYEDLLAPLRVDNSRTANEILEQGETFHDMKAVLLTWNRHITSLGDYTTGRELLITALHERLKAINKVHEIIKDKRASEIYDRIGQEAILEPSARRILQALHVFRPETRSFKNQDPLDILVILWANTCPEIPDIKTDDSLKYLTLKVLAEEQGLAQGYINEGLRRQIERRLDSARQRKDNPECIRLEKKKEQYEKEVAKQAIQSSIHTIFAARRDLRKEELKNLQDLTVLQAAQKLAARNSFENNTDCTPNWTNLRNSCAQADSQLDRARRQCLDDLEANVQVSSNNIQEMRSIHEKVLTRTLKLGGYDLNKVDERTRRRIVEERKRQPVTARMMSETLNGVLESRQAAGQMLRQVEVMEDGLGELLDAARGRYREYDGLVRLVDKDWSLSVDGEEVVLK